MEHELKEDIEEAISRLSVPELIELIRRILDEVLVREMETAE